MRVVKKEKFFSEINSKSGKNKEYTTNFFALN